MTLNELRIGDYAKVLKVNGDGALRQHFLDMGIIPNSKIRFEKTAPMGDPIQITIKGYELTLRLSDANNIEIEKINKDVFEKDINQNVKNRDIGIDIGNLHPGIGESGKFHSKKNEKPCEKGTVLSFALMGNQNSGKTTLFNQLTGSNQHVGNFPGVTVDRKSGQILKIKNTIITDLPGIYSMSPYTKEEIVSRNFILNDKPNCIINIIDAMNIERNLYLTMQLLEMDVPVVIALNMMDEVMSNGGSIDVNKIEKLLGVPVVPISALKNQGVSELIDHAVHIAKYDERPLRIDFCDENDNGGSVHRCIHAVVHLIADHAQNVKIPIRFAATKVIEGDKLIIDKLNLDLNELEAIEHIIVQMENERGLDRKSAMADMRFNFIDDICKIAVKKPHESKEYLMSKNVDKLLTGKWTAIPIFIIIMILIFYITFVKVGPFFQNILEGIIDALGENINEFLIVNNVNYLIRGIIVDGIIGGVGAVISFIPFIIILFFFLSMLEDSGYIARVAFFMDKAMRKIGLSGRSIVSLLIGFGCTVPAVMSTRTIPSERDRRMTILLTPFMSCTAKLPIYIFFVNAFFRKNGTFILPFLYILGILMAIVVSFIYRHTMVKGEAVPFVMELPNYRIPSPKNVLQLLWEKTKDFLQRAFTIILVATIIVWILQSFDVHFNIVENSENSIMAKIASVFVPLLNLVGLGDWRISTALISGFMAKESVVSTMKILFENSGGIDSLLTYASALSLLVFSLLYTPCIATIAAIKRELGIKMAIFVMLWQCVIAWIISFIVYNIAMKIF